MKIHSVFKTLLRLSPTAMYCVVCLLLAASCTKSVEGPKGDPGEPGKPGNMRQRSVPITVSASSWAFDGKYYISTVYLPEITDDVYNRGEAKIYMKIDNAWWSLPYLTGDVVMQASIKKGFVILKYYKIHGAAPGTPSYQSFRIVTFVSAQP